MQWDIRLMLKNAIKTVIIINQVSPNLTLLSQFEVETSLTLVGHDGHFEEVPFKQGAVGACFICRFALSSGFLLEVNNDENQNF